jgi:hypothetical protein
MRRREDKAITKHTLNLFAGDFARLQVHYGHRIGAAKIIRDLVHSHIRKIEERAGQSVPLVEDLDIDLEEVTE